MQILFLLAGNNTRFFPLETMGHKAMNWLYGKPVAEYTLLELKAAGVNEFIFVLGKYDEDVKSYFGDGSKWNVKIEYVHQKVAKGQADAMLTAKALIRGDFGVINPYHFLQAEVFKKMVETFQNDDVDGVLAGRYEENASEYGIFTLDGDRILNLTEKPPKDKLPSHIAKTSLELYRHDFIKYLEAEPEQVDGEFYPNIEAIIKLSKNEVVKLVEIPRDQFIPSLKYSWDLLELWENFSVIKNERNYISQESEMKEGVKVINSNIEKGVQIGKNTVIENSIIMEGVQIGDDCTISNSIIGKHTKIGNGVRTITKSDDTKTVFTIVKGKEVDSAREELGVVVGQQSEIKHNVTIHAGVLIGEKSQVNENMVVSDNLAHMSKI